MLKLQFPDYSFFKLFLLPQFIMFPDMKEYFIFYFDLDRQLFIERYKINRLLVYTGSIQWIHQIWIDEVRLFRRMPPIRKTTRTAITTTTRTRTTTITALTPTCTSMIRPSTRVRLELLCEKIYTWEPTIASRGISRISWVDRSTQRWLCPRSFTSSFSLLLDPFFRSWVSTLSRWVRVFLFS